MNNDDLYVWKLNVRICLLELLAQQSIRATAQAQQNPDAWLEEFCQQLERRFSILTFPTRNAVQSDMLAAEAQECAKNFLSQLRSGET